MKATLFVQSIRPQGLWLDVVLGDGLLFKTELSLESKNGDNHKLGSLKSPCQSLRNYAGDHRKREGGRLAS